MNPHRGFEGNDLCPKWLAQTEGRDGADTVNGSQDRGLWVLCASEVLDGLVVCTNLLADAFDELDQRPKNLRDACWNDGFASIMKAVGNAFRQAMSQAFYCASDGINPVSYTHLRAHET